MTRTILDFTPDGLKRRLADMERQLADIQRRGAWNFDGDNSKEEATASGQSAQLLAMSVGADSIASGGDYVDFTGLVAQHGFSTVSGPGDSWTHPVSGVYVLTFEMEWAAYTGGGTIALEVDGTLVPEGTIATGTDGQSGRGVIAYVVEAGQVGKIKVTQSSGSAKTCAALVRVAITDPRTSAASSASPSNVVSMGTQDVPDVVEWTAGGAAWVDGDAQWIWHTALSGSSRPGGEEAWFEGRYASVAAVAVIVEFSADNSADVWLNGTSLGSVADFTARTATAVTLQAGENLIEVYAANAAVGSPNPAAFILSVRRASDDVVLFRTNDSFGWTGYTAAPPGWSH